MPLVRAVEKEFSAGTIDPTTVTELHHRFLVENVSEKTLRIDRVYSSCSCSTAKVASLLPAKTAIPVDVDVRVTNTNRGQHHKEVILFFKDDGVAPVRLSINVAFAPSFDYEPRAVAFGEVDGRSETKREIVLTASSHDAGGELRIFGVEASGLGGIEIGKAHSRTAPGWVGEETQMVSFDMAVKSTAEASGKFNGFVKVASNSKSHPIVTIPVSYEVLAQEQFSPPSLFFGEMAKQEARERRITLRSPSTLKLDQVKIDVPEFEVKNIEVTDRAVTVSVKFIGTATSGRHEGVLSVIDAQQVAHKAQVAAVVN